MWEQDRNIVTSYVHGPLVLLMSILRYYALIINKPYKLAKNQKNMLMPLIPVFCGYLIMVFFYASSQQQDHVRPNKSILMYCL